MNQLPEGWVPVRISDLGEIRLGKMLDKAKNKGQSVKYLRNINVRWFEFDLSDTQTMLASPDECEQLSVRDGDLFICEGGEPGRCAVWRKGENAFVYQKALHRVRTISVVVPEFLMYRLRLEAESGKLQDAFTGTTIKHLTRESLSNYLIPLPPIDEQRRIVAKLKPLIGSIDAYQRRLAKIPVILNRFRQAVLSAAMSGNLTAEWRNKRSDAVKDTWKKVEFFDFCVLQRGYDLPLSQRIEGIYPIVTSAGEVANHSQFKANGPGVVMGRSGSIGKVYYVKKNYWPHNTALYVKDFKGNFPKYVYYFLLGLNAEQFGASTAVPTLNRNNLRTIFVEVPPIAEQQEIVRHVETLFKLADQIEASYQRAKPLVDKLPQSILAKAFRGELVPTEAELARHEGRDYEPALVLLERIKSERAEHEQVRKEKARSQPRRARLARGAKPRI